MDSRRQLVEGGRLGGGGVDEKEEGLVDVKCGDRWREECISRLNGNEKNTIKIK